MGLCVAGAKLFHFDIDLFHGFEMAVLRFAWEDELPVVKFKLTYTVDVDASLE